MRNTTPEERSDAVKRQYLGHKSLLDDHKVWVLMETDCARESIFYGVFSTKEKAQKYIDDNHGKKMDGYLIDVYKDMSNAYIEEFKLDEGI